MSRRTLLVLITTGLALLLPATALVASAATLGPVSSRQLGAWVLPGGSGAPTVAVWDGFTRANGTNLDGQRTGGNGPAWDVISGTWTTTANTAQSANTTADAVIVVDCARADASVTAVLTTGASFSAGLTLKQSAAGWLAVDWSSANNGTIELVRMLYGFRSVLATATNVGKPSPATLTATYNGGDITVQLNGVTRLTHTLSALNEWIYGSSTSFGLYATGDQTTRFDDFRCEY